MMWSYGTGGHILGNMPKMPSSLASYRITSTSFSRETRSEPVDRGESSQSQGDDKLGILLFRGAFYHFAPFHTMSLGARRKHFINVLRGRYARPSVARRRLMIFLHLCE